MSEQPEKESQDTSTPSTKGSAPKPRRAEKKRGSGFGRFLLLLIILGGLGAAGWFGWQWLNNAESHYTAQMTAQQKQLRELRAEIRALRESTVDVSAFAEAQDAMAMSQDALRDQVNSLAGAVENLRDAAQGGRRDLLQAEIEFLLRIAADELYLTGDVDAAIYALQAADDRLRALQAPQLNPVRELIAQHLTALGAVAVPDTSGMALKLGSMMRGVKALPLDQSSPLREQEEANDIAGEDAGLWERIKAGTHRLLTTLVKVEEAAPPKPLLTPDQHFFLYRNVELQLAAARAALLQGDAAAYRQSLETARQWLSDYFDRDNAQVAGMLEDVNGLLAVSLHPDLPDISGALNRFRRLTSSGLQSNEVNRR